MKKTNPHINTIIAVDEVLSMLREKLIASKTDKDKADVMSKINSVLDERLRLMKLRDSYDKP